MIRNWSKSREYLERAKQSLTGGVSSPFRAKTPVPLYFRNGCGARLEDVDGNEYIDYALAWGPMILGYRHPAIVQAMRRQAELPIDYGAQHELEFEVAELIQRSVPCAQLVSFTSSGSEAVHIALRLARAFTGRQLILKFEGPYHGWLDGALVSYKPSCDQAGPPDRPNVVFGSRGQVANTIDNFVIAPWNDAPALQRILDSARDRVAAIILEPVMCNSGCILPQPGYLEQVQCLCRKHGALLIFDEVITGFRMSPGGAQQAFNITPDLCTFGKAVAGGAVLSGIAGRRDNLTQMMHGVAFGGTFNGNPVSLACAQATITELTRNDGAPLKRANQLGLHLMDAIRTIAKRHRVDVCVTGFGTAFSIHFTSKPDLLNYRDTLDDDSEKLQRFLFSALEHGLNLIPDGRIYISTAHTERDIEETITRLDPVFATLQNSSRA